MRTKLSIENYHAPHEVNSGFYNAAVSFVTREPSSIPNAHMSKINALVSEVLAELKDFAELSNNHLLEDYRIQVSGATLEGWRLHS